mmetsp:Transcript_66563/g.98665  ORF Transcript_66563/g.98665 Transcript_66563/m.98665 type:complete len:145 (+) Transcript_66563:4558-4992(+)
MGQTIHHEGFPHPDYQIKALACHLHHILHQGKTEDSLLCKVHNTSAIYHVMPTDMIKLLRQAVRNLKLNATGINPNLIGTHSLCVGGAMALKLYGANDTTIMKLGHWSSSTFLMYIHNQIGHLAKDLPPKMRTNLPFLNIAAIN